MAWLKIDDGLFLHPKWLSTPTGARALWISALSYAGKFANGGIIHKAVLPVLGGTPDDAEALVASGLWEREGDAYLIHDFSLYNESSTPEAKGHLSEVRAEAGRQGGLASAEARQSKIEANVKQIEANSKRNEANAKQTPSKSQQNQPPEPEPLGIHTTLVRTGTQCAGGPAEGEEASSRPTRRDTPPHQPAQRPPTLPGTRPRPQANRPTATKEDYAAPPGSPPQPPRNVAPSDSAPSARDARPENRRDREAFIAQVLAQADADPERRHWRAALADTLAHAIPREPDRYQASILAAWLAGESLPPKPAPTPRAVTMQDMEALYGLAPGERMTPGPFPSTLAAEAEREKAEKAAELQAIANRARAADPRPVIPSEVTP